MVIFHSRKLLIRLKIKKTDLQREGLHMLSSFVDRLRVRTDGEKGYRLRK
jgi:hypothetical protein